MAQTKQHFMCRQENLKQFEKILQSTSSEPQDLCHQLWQAMDGLKGIIDEPFLK